MSQPHASWATAYDQLYEKSFGSVYDRLTQHTLTAIENLTAQDSRIVDFGAGTGRLAIPLARTGRSVTAVEPCVEMLQILSSKKQETVIELVNCTMAAFNDPQPYDFATCVFTVLLYLLDEEDLQSSLLAASNALKPSGLLMLDVPTQDLFQSFIRQGIDFERRVTITPLKNNLYQYQEDSTLTDADKVTHRYGDDFKIKYWPLETVLSQARRCGLTLHKDLSDEYAGTGSSYLLLKKTN